MSVLAGLMALGHAADIVRLAGASDTAGPHLYPAMYGRVFTAWGVAGLGGPFMAGALFDQTGSYSIALIVAATAAALAAGLHMPARR